jgi:hypothetical protein
LKVFLLAEAEMLKYSAAPWASVDMVAEHLELVSSFAVVLRLAEIYLLLEPSLPQLSAVLPAVLLVLSA